MGPTIAVLVIIALLAYYIYRGLRSRQAKKQLWSKIELSSGQRLPDLHERIVRGLPPGWRILGEGGARDRMILDNDPNPESDINFLRLARGGAFRGVYAVGIHLTVAIEDAHGFMQETGFEELPPQDEYNAHIWVFYASRGQRMWGLFASNDVIALKHRLCDVLNVNYEQALASA